MKTIILSVIALCLMIGAQSVYAVSDIQSGHNHECDDADKQPNERYINSIGNGPSHHTAEYMKGYHQGYKAFI
jgi:hypothetical protein